MTTLNEEQVAKMADQYLPRMFRDADLNESIDPRIRAWAESPRGTLFLYGPVGSGKSHTAGAVVRRYLRNPAGQPWVFTAVVADLLPSIQPGKIPNDELGTLLDPHFRAQRAGMTWLDDLGAHKVSEWREEVLGTIIDYRYREMLPTVITSNLRPAQIGEMVGDRIASRLAADSTVVLIDSADRRRA